MSNSQLLSSTARKGNHHPLLCKMVYKDKNEMANLIMSTFHPSSIPISLPYATLYRFAYRYQLLFLPCSPAKDPLNFPLPSQQCPTMAEATEKKSVRITLADSGLSPPVYVLASFTNPPWKPHELMAAGARGQAYDDPSVVQVDYKFWGQFDVDPGVWTYKFRVGWTDWLLCDHRTETGKIFRYADSQSNN